MDRPQEPSGSTERVTHFDGADSDIFQDEEDVREFRKLLDDAKAKQVQISQQDNHSK